MFLGLGHLELEGEGQWEMESSTLLISGDSGGMNNGKDSRKTSL